MLKLFLPVNVILRLSLFAKDSQSGRLSNTAIKLVLSGSSILNFAVYCDPSLTVSSFGGLDINLGGSSSNEILISTLAGSLQSFSSQALKVKLSISVLAEVAS